jgi:hypothetical protein
MQRSAVRHDGVSRGFAGLAGASRRGASKCSLVLPECRPIRGGNKAPGPALAAVVPAERGPKKLRDA